MFFLGIFATVVTKVLGIFGSGFLNSVLGVITNGQTQKTAQFGFFTNALVHAMTAEVQTRQIASTERIALWDSLWYRGLIYLIIVPPSSYHAAVWTATLFPGLGWSIPAAPERFEQWGWLLMSGFMGIGGFVGGIVGFGRSFFRTK